MFLENGLTQDEVHPIEMDIQSNSNIVHHHLTPAHNWHTKLMKW